MHAAEVLSNTTSRCRSALRNITLASSRMSPGATALSGYQVKPGANIRIPTFDLNDFSPRQARTINLSKRKKRHTSLRGISQEAAAYVKSIRTEENEEKQKEANKLRYFIFFPCCGNLLCDVSGFWDTILQSSHDGAGSDDQRGNRRINEAAQRPEDPRRLISKYPTQRLPSP